jgi:hypothetical protein
MEGCRVSNRNMKTKQQNQNDNDINNATASIHQPV